MRHLKFLAPILLGLLVTVGCTKTTEPVVIPTTEKAEGTKFEKTPTKTADGFAVPENMAIEAGPVKDVEK